MNKVFYQIGIDVGGTFTDVVVAHGSNVVATYKASTTPNFLSEGVLSALRGAAEQLGLSIEQLLEETSIFIHGTTVATNTVLTRRGAKVGLICTSGFRDVLEIARGMRTALWDIRTPNPTPLVPRDRIYEIDERITADGSVLKTVDIGEVRNLIRRVKEDGVESLAICLFNSYSSSVNEDQVRKICEEFFNFGRVFASSEVLPISGEYERTSTVVLAAFVGPAIAQYLERLEQELQLRGLHSPLLIMTNNGGALPAIACIHSPVLTLLSGPAAGPSAASSVGQLLDEDEVILIDMGGTSTDISIIRQKTPDMRDSTSVAGYVAATRSVDVESIGVGGGSIAWVSGGGLLHVGPDGVGADPGPACYDKGGTKATVTDANLVLGRLGIHSLLGGRMHISLDLASEAIDRNIARPLGLSIPQAAHAITRIAVQNMANAIRLKCYQKGLDPRNLVLVTAGGAAGLHVRDIGAELGIYRAILPRLASTLCPVGMLQAGIRQEFLNSRHLIIQKTNWREQSKILLDDLSRLAAQAYQTLADYPIDSDEVVISSLLDIRYSGQQWSIPVPLDHDGNKGKLEYDEVRKRFERLHEAMYGYRNERADFEIIAVRLYATVEAPYLDLQRPASQRVNSTHASFAQSRRSVYLMDNEVPHEISVFSGDQLVSLGRIQGPCILEESDTTVYLAPGDVAIATTPQAFLLEIATNAPI